MKSYRRARLSGIIFIGFLVLGLHAVDAQQRQSDSMRLKQYLRNKQIADSIEQARADKFKAYKSPTRMW
ncbi:MAG: hypothetical protein HWD58_09125 [Bacteroidota bacterium]|nr:MAG: hypothetical protein HWD58_09125 [Bacteroidota bacterium]